jgi:hypothetical protein
VILFGFPSGMAGISPFFQFGFRDITIDLFGE